MAHALWLVSQWLTTQTRFFQCGNGSLNWSFLDHVGDLPAPRTFPPLFQGIKLLSSPESSLQHQTRSRFGFGLVFVRLFVTPPSKSTSRLCRYLLPPPPLDECFFLRSYSWFAVVSKPFPHICVLWISSCPCTVPQGVRRVFFAPLHASNLRRSHPHSCTFRAPG